MEAVRRALLTIATVLAAAVPAAAQDASGNGGSGLIFVWVWILVAGIIIMIVGTSMGVSSGKK